MKMVNGESKPVGGRNLREFFLKFGKPLGEPYLKSLKNGISQAGFSILMEVSEQAAEDAASMLAAYVPVKVLEKALEKAKEKD